MLSLAETQRVPLAMREDGTIHIRGSRVTLDTIVACYQNGDSPEEIVEDFPTLSLAHVYGTIAYYLEYRKEVGEYLERRHLQAKTVRDKIETEFPSSPLRAKLLARHASMNPPDADAESVGR